MAAVIPPPLSRVVTSDGGGERTINLIDIEAALSAPVEPTDWLIDGFASPGCLTILAAGAGEGKSFLTLGLAAGVAEGKPVAGMDCKKGRAMVLDAENGERETRRRLQALRVPKKDLWIAEAGRFRIDKHIEELRELIVVKRLDLVVLDSWRLMTSGAEENSQDIMEPLVTALKLLARETNTAIILLHHRGKGDDAPAYRGSSVILDQADMMFTLTREKEDSNRGRRKISTVKCRIDEDPADRWISIKKDEETGRALLAQGAPYLKPDKRTSEERSARDRLMDAMCDRRLTWTEWAGRAGLNPEAGNARAARDQLASEGFVVQTPDKSWEAVESVTDLCTAKGVTG